MADAYSESKPAIGYFMYKRRGVSEIRNLNLAENQLTGSIPDELWTRDTLQFLSLGFNLLSGSISESVGRRRNPREPGT